MIDLVRDVLDKQLVDRTSRPLGKVDGILLELRAGAPPRVAYLESGLPAAVARIAPGLVRWARALERRLGVARRPLRIPIDVVGDVGVTVALALDGRRTRAFAWEDWLRKRVIARIPGGG